MDIARTEKLSLSHHRIHTEILIDAAPETVWSVLTDTRSYADWAAFLVGIEGSIANDAEVTLAFQLDPAKKKLTRIDHTLSVAEGESFYWAETGPGGIRDNHHFRVEPADGGRARFIQSDEIMGGLTWLMGRRLARMYRDGYQAFNRTLKAEAERRAGA